MIKFFQSFSGLSSIAALALLGCTSCATTSESNRRIDPTDDPRLQRDLTDEATYIGERGYSFWDGDKEGRLSVKIDLSDQTAYFFRDGVPAGRSRVATGRAGHRTPTGSFSIMTKDADKRSNLYGQIFDKDGSLIVADADTRRDDVPPGGRYVGAAMPYWMRLTDSGIGMHVGPIPNPGRPASHGCIRMPRELARRLFDSAPVGTKVTIVR